MELLRGRDETVFVVDDEDGRFQGLLTLYDLRLTLADPMMGQLVTLGDVLYSSYPRISPSMSLRDAVREFTTTKLEALPVFNSENEFIGLVTRDAVLTAYGKAKRAV